MVVPWGLELLAMLDLLELGLICCVACFFIVDVGLAATVFGAVDVLAFAETDLLEADFVEILLELGLAFVAVNLVLDEDDLLVFLAPSVLVALTE